MSSDETTLRVLYEIRDGIRTTNDRLDGTNARLDQTNAHLDVTIARLDQSNARLDQTIERLDDTGERVGRVETRTERLGGQIVESEVRTATAINETTFAIRELHRMMKDRFDLRDRVERCERDIDELKRKRD